METLTVKLPEKLMTEIKRAMKDLHYGTKSEFVREAIREKLIELKHGDTVAQLKASLKDIKKGRIYRVA